MSDLTDNLRGDFPGEYVKEAAARIEELEDALIELVEVANLRGDNELPAPPDDPLLWSARMQTAWDEAERVVRDG